MATKIEWTHVPNTIGVTWNPITGCTKISPGCRNCYAERMCKRLQGRFGYPQDDPFRVTLHPDRLDHPVHWRKPRTAFVCSMGDLFHDDVHPGDIARIWATMSRFSAHTFLVLTKRPGRMCDILHYLGRHGGVVEQQNIWVGTSVEDVARLRERLPLLQMTPAWLRFVSLSPMLEPLSDELRPYLGIFGPRPADCPEEVDHCNDCEVFPCRMGTSGGPGLDWVILEGENASASRAREFPVDDAIQVVETASSRGIPVFVKQMGTRWARANGRKDRHGRIPELWPEQLQRREWPGTLC